MKHRLEALSATPIELQWHENKTVYLTVKKERGRFLLRLHRLFYDAPTPVLEALIRYAERRDKQAKAIIRQMAHLYFSKNRAEPRWLNTQGEVYDLQEIFEGLQKIIPLEGIAIGWSDRKVRGKYRSITFGTFNQHTRQIRINPILDHPQVPLYFLEFIVYHEMLHAVYPTQMDVNGRCSIHTKEFRDKERQFPLFEEAKIWGKKSFIFFKKVNRGRP